MKAHPTALVDPAASIADDVEIGPFCIVGAAVTIGPGCRLGTRVTLHGPAAVGRDNAFHPHVTVGKPGGGRVEIGDANVFRESAHIDAPTAGTTTRIGSRTRFGAWAGAAGGCSIGNDVRVGAFSVVGQDGVVEDEAWIEGQCVIEAGRRIGRASLVRSQVPVTADVPPFMCLDGNPAEIQSVNPHRRNHLLEMAFEIVFKSGLSFPEAARKLLEKPGAPPELEALAGFLKTAKPPEAVLD